MLLSPCHVQSTHTGSAKRPSRVRTYLVSLLVLMIYVFCLGTRCRNSWVFIVMTLGRAYCCVPPLYVLLYVVCGRRGVATVAGLPTLVSNGDACPLLRVRQLHCCAAP